MLTAVVSRHTFVWCTYRQTTEAVTPGGFAVLIPANMNWSDHILDAQTPDEVEVRLTRRWEPRLDLPVSELNPQLEHPQLPFYPPWD